MSGHKSEVSASAPETLFLNPILVLVKVYISAVEGIKGMSQDSALPIKGLSVPVRSVINQVGSAAKSCPY